MTDWTQFHPTQPMTTPDGDTVNIDVEMVPLVVELWRLGYVTKVACQDAGEAVREGGTRVAKADRTRVAARTMARAWLIVQADQGPQLLDSLEELDREGDWRHFPVVKDEHPESWISITFPRRQIAEATALLRTK
ncbi:hypothetical protein [Spirillospora sp. NPDC048819]|uniref:hypothetical protein n=1 Tax=Spirillospora sp. NPDC048819 TaxID=3155268 RepID=UPI0033D9DBC5